MKKLSIVVPIYKAEKYIEQCVRSILDQEFRDIELLLVDDGSPDRCPALCESFAAEDPRVRVLHKPNGGAASARKAGYLTAQGEYVLFFDADDWAEPRMLAEVFEKYEGEAPDIVIMGYVTEMTDGSTVMVQHPSSSGIYTGGALSELKDEALYKGRYYVPGLYPALWNKILRRRLLEQIIPAVDDSIRMGEDGAVFYPALVLAEKVIVDNGICAYHYRDLPGSLSKAFHWSYFSETFALVSWLEAFFAFAREGEDKRLRSLDYYTLFLLDIGVSWLVSSCPKKELPGLPRKLREATAPFRLPEILGRVRVEEFTPAQWRVLSLFGKERFEGYVLLKLGQMAKCKLKDVIG